MQHSDLFKDEWKEPVFSRGHHLLVMGVSGVAEVLLGPRPRGSSLAIH